MKVLAIDVSGNFKEGKGTSGLCYMDRGEIISLAELKASNFDVAEAYWDKHTEAIEVADPDVLVIEGYRLYNHRGMKASSQANSELETPQLIGALKLYCHKHNIPVVIQYAHEVKSRWSEKVLVAKGYLEAKNGNRYHFKGEPTNDHKRDALKHALHYWRYGDHEY